MVKYATYSHARQGFLEASLAYLLWGFLPIYWYFLHDVTPAEVLCHRVVWSGIFLSAYLFATGKLKEGASQIFASKKTVVFLTVNALLIGANWFIYIWAISVGRVLETSLGYFMNPIFSIFLGAVILSEKLNRIQWAAVFLICLAMLVNMSAAEQFPWVAISLAVTFAIYGLIKKQTGIGSITSLWYESLVIAAPCLWFLTNLKLENKIAFMNSTAWVSALLVGSGLVTSVPLLLFGLAAKKIRLSTIGVLQFIAPTIQFFLGLYYFQEEFNLHKFLCFAVVWIAVCLYVYGLKQSRYLLR